VGNDWKEATVTYLKVGVIALHLSGDSEENHATLIRVTSNMAEIRIVYHLNRDK
jgi:hypothetical protein